MRYDASEAFAGNDDEVDHNTTILLSVQDLKRGMYVSRRPPAFSSGWL